MLMVDQPNVRLPSGVVTFLFTDVRGSTAAWEESPEAMALALEQHDEAIIEAVSAHNGIPVKARGEGDSWFVVFESATDAVAGAAEVQRRLSEVERATSPGLVVRASLHTGVRSRLDGSDYEDAFARGESASFDSVLNELVGRGVAPVPV
jgi:class 3 adenylate cyclase